MKLLSDVMSAAGLSGWAEVALLIFFGCFVALGIWLFLTRSSPEWEKARFLPLDDGRAPLPDSGESAVSKAGRDGEP